MVEKRRTVQGVKKKKKLRWSSAGSITTAAGGDDLLKATRSQPLGPKRGTTLLVFPCSLFSLSAPYSPRALSLLLLPSFCLSLFRSLSFRASAFLGLAELCMVLSLLPSVFISPSLFRRSSYIFLIHSITGKLIDRCEKYCETQKIIQRAHAVNFRFFSLKLIMPLNAY